MDFYAIYATLILALEVLLFVFEVGSYEVVGNIFEEDGRILENPAKQGSNLLLKCKGSKSYEHCTWRHQGYICNYEWMRKALFIGGYLKKKYCNRYFLHKIEVQKEKYKNHECSILLRNVGPSDEGDWSCHLEEYNLGPTIGERGSISFNLTVEGSEETGILIYCN